MSDTTATPTNDSGNQISQEEAVKATEAKSTEPEPAKETDWKAEARKWEERAKSNKDAAEKLAEIEEAKKSEAQKAAERMAELEGKVKQYEAKEQIAAWKAEVSEATGVPANVLAGSTKEEIEAHGETLKPLIDKNATRTVRGIEKTPGANQADPNDWLRDMARG